ncbi:MAG: TonB-dependent receptor family protein [Archangium sp.]
MDRSVEKPTFNSSELMLKGGYTADPTAFIRNSLELKVGFSTERSNESYLGISDSDFAANPQRRYAASQLDQMNWWRTQVQLTHRFEIGDWLEVVTTAYRHDFDRTWLRFDHFAVGPDPYRVLTYPAGTNASYLAILRGDADSVGDEQRLVLARNRRTFFSQGIQLNAVARAKTGPLAHELELGFRFHNDQIIRRHTGDSYDMVSAHLVAADVPVIPLAENLAMTRAFSAHLSDTISWGNLLLSPGIRLETPYMHFNDRLSGAVVDGQSVVPLVGGGAVYRFDSGLSLLGGVHQGFSPVAPGQAPEVMPERAVNSEVGMRYGRSWLRTELIGFWSEYDNITGECTGSTGCTSDAINQQFNGGHARVLGVEALASVRGRLPLGFSVHADLAYTFTHATFTTKFVSANPVWGSVDPGDFLPYIPMHQGQLRLRGAWRNYELGIGAMYYGEQRELAGLGTIPDELRIPDRVLMDLTASAEFGAARFYLTINNLTNQSALVSRRPFGARPQAPLMVQVGLKYAFR